MKISKLLDEKYLLIGYIFGLGALGIYLIVTWGWWGLLIESIIVAVVSPLLTWYLLKKWGFIDWARDMSEHKYIYGLEIMKKIRPKKAAELEPLVDEWYKERAKEGKNGTNAARKEHKSSS